MEHDKLATRLSLIIYKLNQGERLTIESLANEFGVSKRTIERDIARFSYFDIKKEGKEFFLDELAVGKLNFDDIKNFAIFSGIKSLYPSLTNQFLKDILNEKINRAYMVQNSGFEDIQEKQQLFENLSTAIIEEKTISFFYNDKKRVSFFKDSCAKVVETQCIKELFFLDSINANGSISKDIYILKKKNLLWTVWLMKKNRVIFDDLSLRKLLNDTIFYFNST
ncbi:MAG TPA: HTH domain-containing protein, partial [Aliarcobacter cryaerophilus]|nr:HTH domain-containing protein [Aliarcobacter cryaerophilus]